MPWLDPLRRFLPDWLTRGSTHVTAPPPLPVPAGGTHVAAHAHSSDHREEVLASSVCGCFHCLAVFGPGEIEEWVDEDGAGEGQTALCPSCGIDSVLPGRVGYLLTPEFLARMRKHWFGPSG
jgi:hypothetical protein